ncbi:phosphoenolpyruvate--protein phosphotransferase [Motilimonas sp. 1_MG-2023]|uniref:phosphoenolpyruvate--protein phosphotransferase n=1 Tax=Motilimonas TaxID=1914248 RepID=UPI001E59341C|nr:phosphoenolpyruvate--protein phosphotransferase [Motilimonas sp. 1_MG-2023]MCE0558589.1 phosphoenolpyruvate--protein phosphotransferase [Motilimonas sp. E26]MDO6527942.1 phosphoenolpyruvate--protein phosphotransferase [Motilimonas sp. 1_MG-2023]
MLTQLREIVEHVNLADSLEDAMGVLVSEIRQVMQVDCCSVYLAHDSLSHFTLAATDGLAASAVGNTHIDFSEGVVGLVGQKEEPLNLADVQIHPRFKYLPEVQEDDFRAFLGAPIIHQRKVLGVLVVQQRCAREYDINEESFIVTLAAQLANVIAHSQAKGMFSSPNPQRKTIRSIKGIAGSPGIAIAKAQVITPQVTLDMIEIEPSQDIDGELVRFTSAVQQSIEEIKGIAFRLKGQLPKEALAIFDIYQHMLAEVSLSGEIKGEIRTGLKATAAVKQVAVRYIQQFKAMSDPYLRERATDTKDVCQRLINHLIGLEPAALIADELILVAEEVTATMLANVPKEKLKGIVSVKGSANSHAAILARALGIPALMGMSVPIEKLSHNLLILDGYSGELYVSPEQAVQNEYEGLLAEEKQLDSIMLDCLEAPAVTRDGIKIEMLLNAGLSADTEIAINEFADGVGLYRTEVPFMLTESFPTEQEQTERYRGILHTYAAKPVTMRTLDVGGDKQLPYFPIIEENPFLGWRGIRLTLDHPEIFLVQIKAMLRASIGLNNLQIMLPMISGVSEVDDSIRLINQAWNEIKERAEAQGEILRKPKLGVMLEVPSALYILPQLAKRVDFWSIGSNDLTQYLLAVDRNNPRVANIFDSFHPAVLQALQHIIAQAKQHKVPVSLCGELAGDPLGAVILMAMGYTKLSMNTYNIARIKFVIRHVSVKELQALLGQAYELDSGKEVRALFAQYLEAQGLGGLVRAGR